MTKHQRKAAHDRASLYDDITKDHRRVGGRPAALAPALGHCGGEGAVGHAAERLTGRAYSVENDRATYVTPVIHVVFRQSECFLGPVVGFRVFLLTVAFAVPSLRVQ
ncbi:hypothetical protein [Bradyrhizobium sp. USDA 3315]